MLSRWIKVKAKKTNTFYRTLHSRHTFLLNTNVFKNKPSIHLMNIFNVLFETKYSVMRTILLKFLEDQ